MEGTPRVAGWRVPGVAVLELPYLQAEPRGQKQLLKD